MVRRTVQREGWDSSGLRPVAERATSPAWVVVPAVVFALPFAGFLLALWASAVLL